MTYRKINNWNNFFIPAKGVRGEDDNNKKKVDIPDLPLRIHFLHSPQPEASTCSINRYYLFPKCLNPFCLGLSPFFVTH